MSKALTTLVSELTFCIQSIEDNAEIYYETHFNSRADTLDQLDFHVIGRIEGLLSAVSDTKLEQLEQRAGKVKHRLEIIDTNLFKRLRKQISSGSFTGVSFKAMIHKYLDNGFSHPNKIGYDNLDIFINGLLASQPLPEATLARDPEMVFYQQTPARVIFEMAELLGPAFNNTFFDIGSGLGHVPLLINLLTGAKTRGIEYEPAYCDYATACACSLNLSDVTFVNTAAQNADYAEGTTFFMYTPFEGTMLLQMLGILKNESHKKPLRLFTYGPCSPYVAQQTWLNCVNGPADDIYKLYEFRPRGLMQKP
jgi:hypothetical protein